MGIREWVWLKKRGGGVENDGGGGGGGRVPHTAIYW